MLTPTRFVLVTAGFLAALASCDDTSFPSAAGVWQFTLSPQGTDKDTVTGTAEVSFEEYGSSVTGYAMGVALLGTREGNRITFDVISAHGESTAVESRLDLRVLDEDTLVGTGVVVSPVVPTPVQDDGTVHPKHQTTNEDWDGGAGGTRFFDVDAVRVDSIAPALIHKKTAALNIKSLLCTAVGTVESFAVSTLTDNLVRPMGDCTIQHDGDGYYLFGRDAPGSVLPVWTQTIYYPFKLIDVPHDRTFHFTFTMKGPVLGDVWGELLKTNDKILSKLKLTATEWVNMATATQAKFGGFAILIAKGKSHTTSFYVFHEKGGTEVWKDPLVDTLYASVAASAGKVEKFRSNGAIKDTFGLYMGGATLVSTPLGIAYLIGTHKVWLD